MRAVYANAALLLNVVPVGMDDESSTARFVRGAAQRLGYTLGLQVTGGSSSVRDAWGPMRLAGATARQLLLQAAAARWNVPVSELRTEGGAVLRGDQRLAYRELVAEAAKLTPPDNVPLKTPEQWRFIGKPMPRAGPARQGQRQRRVWRRTSSSPAWSTPRCAKPPWWAAASRRGTPPPSRPYAACSTPSC